MTYIILKEYSLQYTVLMLSSSFFLNSPVVNLFQNAAIKFRFILISPMPIAKLNAAGRMISYPILYRP